MNTRADALVDLDVARRAKALQVWVEDCKTRMKAHWPEIDFNSNEWPLNTLYKTNLLDVNFAPSFEDFHGKDPAYGITLKCIMAEIALKGGIKDPYGKIPGWRLLSRIDVPLFQLRRAHLTELEKAVVKQALDSPKSASRLYAQLSVLRAHIDLIGAHGVTDRLAWNLAPQTKAQLRGFSKIVNKEFKDKKAPILDRQIEALSDAQTAMFRGDDRLSAYDRVALAVMGLHMCCPNRVNEPLCMATDDRFILEDYQMREPESGELIESQTLERLHQMLLVKGSKGAAWGAKPILNFMMAFSDLCIDVIKQHGDRSRILVTWYEKHPNILYLPAMLEHLRDTEISRATLWQIMNMKSHAPNKGQENSVIYIWKELQKKGFIQKRANPKTHKNNGSRNTRKTVQTVAWSDLEPILLSRVNQAMKDVRRVTPHNHYQGRLSNMLMLFDNEQVPYLPGSIKYGTLIKRLHQTENQKKPSSKRLRHDWKREPTLFEKLDIKMVENGVVKTAYIYTHDPRRWLTTQALDSDLSDVLTNKWANRLNINQLKSYDLRSAERKAEQAAMPVVKELEDMTHGLQKLEALENQYGLKTQLVVLGDANIAVTSMNDIMQATEDRPVARISNQIIILYPQRYGACLHQHHERPCRSYKCAPCNEGVVVKGHLPSNEQIRMGAEMVFRSIVNQLEQLLIARQRQLPDHPERLDEHILTLVREGLNPEKMAKELIARFHEIKDQIKDRSFANKLHEAFALTGYVERLDDESVPSGALIKYHNPSHHAAPGHERALEARHGGRAEMKASREAFEQKYPKFALTYSNKQDQRYLLEPDEDDGQEAVNE
ncbi:hypothetical protein [Malikia spinosa]|uniref:Uncharacterized protein n=1 Tax=Malikia spinosa TaxID=86180 RepID=A0A7C9NVT8_9BURK|nr:hypothetical protein [Malikia spinosa]MYZ51224.1 hypothetical protein [Malikia spinosa]